MGHSLPDNLNINLPDAPDFISEPPKYSMYEMAAMCEPMLKDWFTIRFSEQTPLPEPFTLL